MAVVATDQITVLEAVIARLIKHVPGLNASTCFLSLSDDPPPGVVHNLFVMVSPTNGRFDDGAFAGGAEHTVFENTGVAVTLCSKVLLDRAGQDAVLLTERVRGLLAIKRQVLLALLTNGPLQDPDGSDLLINLMAPLDSREPVYDTETRLGRIALVFSADFHWDMTVAG